ncbi:MAG: Stk1 family PASTA domain-containing Ser/Thr kinase [Lachnospiraceae bacterium]|nr:Stk1 family PASTA domain-containing Ser/Thr kinase [Lachnospiraceae bacterium]
MIKIGMTVAERYEVLEKIGTGGMSDVYRAKDHKLSRFVAVKVLKQEFSENKDFLQKFRSEAQSAAGLMHPNIVNVYDVGEENGSHYIVMELVEGITLKKYIEKKARLSVREAVSIAIQVAQGIEAAHNNHIIHRDIKPQNVIISMDGKVKVTDFGIAKAATSNTITSNVMGSVHYTSPEQVRGGFSDEKSDIYSLGITLFEMLTGRVPFNGDTTVAVAIKHIQEQMPSPREFVPEIPISLEKIVLKCTQKSPDRRYQSAPELIEDLKRSLISPDEDFVKLVTEDTTGETKEIPAHELNQIRSRTRKRDDLDAQMATGQVVEEYPQEEGAAEEYPQDYAEPEYAEGDYQEGNYSEGEYPEENYAQDGYDPNANYDENYAGYEGNEGGEYPEEYVEEYPEEAPGTVQSEMTPPRKRSEGKVSGNTGSTGSKSAKSGSSKSGSSKSGKSGNKSGSSKSSSKTTMAAPAKKNSKNSKNTKNTKKSTTTAKTNRRQRDYDEYDPRMELLTTVLIVIAAIIVGCIFLYIVGSAIGLFGEREPEQQQAPVEATETPVDDGSSAETPIPSGAGTYTPGNAIIPRVVGLTKQEATVALENEGFEVEVIRANSDTVAKDVVMVQDPLEDSKLARGGTVTITVSLGKESSEVPMPDLKGLTGAEATTELDNLGLTLKIVGEEYNDKYPQGQIISQNYTVGSTISSGTEVEVRISLGQEKVYYNVNYTVQAPADYAGGDAGIILVEPTSGQQIWSTTTSSFPVQINITGLENISDGIISINYHANQEQTVTDVNGNVSVVPVQVTKTADPIVVQFTRAQ